VTPLHSFHSKQDPISISGELKLFSARLELVFELSDTRNLADFTAGRKFLGPQLKRADELWKSTCFEAFMAHPKQNAYWEINISSQGGWNLYHFTAYRQPQPPQQNFDFKLIELSTTATQVRAVLEHSLASKQLDASLCCVIKSKNNETFYYSTQHAGVKPDFHLRESFTLTARGSP
jgi:hypothetical protein